MSEAGAIVGEIPTGPGGEAEDLKGRGFVFANDRWAFLEALSSLDHSRARAVNASGFIVGESYIPEVRVSDAAFWVPR